MAKERPYFVALVDCGLAVNAARPLLSIHVN
jgi:hypothetical protein